MWPTFLRRRKRYDALGYEPPAGSQLTETRYAIIACLESTRRCDSAPVFAVAPWSRSSQSLGIWVSSHVVWYMGCVISGKRGTVVLLWRERGQNYRRIAMDSNEHVGGRGQWLHTWHWQHAVDTGASHLLRQV